MGPLKPAQDIYVCMCVPRAHRRGAVGLPRPPPFYPALPLHIDLRCKGMSPLRQRPSSFLATRLATEASPRPTSNDAVDGPARRTCELPGVYSVQSSASGLATLG